jgi:hypothetical protein
MMAVADRAVGASPAERLARSTWDAYEGAELRALEDTPHAWARVVALLNVWNDADELRHSWGSWGPFVDRVIAVDGAYQGVPGGLSTDGTRELLAAQPHVALIDGAGLPQIEKRNIYWKHCRPGDLCIIIDADEIYEGMPALRDAPWLDVGWIRYTSPIYAREQSIPRVFRYRPGLHHADRHHFVYEMTDAGDARLVSENQIGGVGLEHRRLPVRFHNSRGERRVRERETLARVHRQAQTREEAQQPAAGTGIAGREPLHVVHLAPIDPGNAIYRLHTALNVTTPHSSAMAIGRQEWMNAPRQYEAAKRPEAKAAAETADIVHCHVSYSTARSLQIQPTLPQRLCVIHHHGTPLRRAAEVFQKQDDDYGSLRLVSNPELLKHGSRLHYLPNVVPVARYRRLLGHAPPFQPGDVLRVGHSPTKPALKGTDKLTGAVETLRRRGIRIELVMIHKRPLREALELKAGCHVFFDSFWLGIQCSGLEAAAMGRPVLAGDADVKAYWETEKGAVPYTYVEDERALTDALERLATDNVFRAQEAARVFAHVVRYHDEAAVARRYLDLLDAAFSWRRRLTQKRGKIGYVGLT